MNDVPRSKQFDDVYFSAQDGLAETQHVFLNGNNLPDRFKNHQHFTICETGFGTGLNFLAAWQLFDQTRTSDQAMEFISFEKYPLTADEIESALERWETLKHYTAKLCKIYNTNQSVFKFNEYTTLRIYFGDINDTLPTLNTPIDAWFLDGFKPSTNPEMWSETLFQNMARLSKPKTTFATFTSAGAVRRALQSHGYTVQKIPGYGRKREMTIGEFNPEPARTKQ